MAKTWKDLLSDAKTYGDDFVIEVGGDKFSLGDLRKANSESDGDLQRRLDAQKQDLATREQTLTQAQTELATLFQTFSEKTGLSIDDIQKGKHLDKKAATAIASGATGLDPNDPILAPVIKKITDLESGEIARLNGEVLKLTKAVGMALKVNLDDHYEKEFSEISKSLPKDVKDVDLPKALKYAQDNNLMDRHGRFNLRKATDEMTADVRKAADIAAAEERGRKKALEETSMASVSRPGQSRVHLTNSPKNKDGSTKTIEQAIADAANDPDIWNNALATANGAVQ